MLVVFLRVTAVAKRLGFLKLTTEHHDLDGETVRGVLHLLYDVELTVLRKEPFVFLCCWSFCSWYVSRRRCAVGSVPWHAKISFFFASIANVNCLMPRRFRWRRLCLIFAFMILRGSGASGRVASHHTVPHRIVVRVPLMGAPENLAHS